MYSSVKFIKYVIVYISIVLFPFISSGVVYATGDDNNSCSSAWTINPDEQIFQLLNPIDDPQDYFQFIVHSSGTIDLWITTQVANPCVVSWILYEEGGSCSTSKEWGYINQNDSDTWPDIPVEEGTYKLLFQHNGGATGNSYYGFEVSFNAQNQCPVLSDEHYLPDRNGTTDDDYYFYVYYDDPDQDPPDRIRVYINGDLYNMTLWLGQDYSGMYRYGPINLPEGQTTYYFSFRDDTTNACTVRHPEDEEFDGPIITQPNNCFTLSDASVTPPAGTGQTIFTYSVTYQDLDNDIPTVKYVNIDGTNYQMSLSSGSGYNGIYTSPFKVVLSKWFN